MYASHHYVLDIMAGWGCCLVGITATELWFRSSANSKNSWLATYLGLISDNHANGHAYLPLSVNDKEP